MTAQENKLKGAVREIGLTHDIDHNNSFTVTINIQIKTEGRVSYDEAEKLASKYRREYLGKEVEFLAVNLPCPVCNKIMNSETGLKKHIQMSHPERTDLIVAPKAEKDTKSTKNMKKTPLKETRRNSKKSSVNSKKNIESKVKTVKGLSKATKIKKGTPTKKKIKTKTEKPLPVKIESSKQATIKNVKLKPEKTTPTKVKSNKPPAKKTELSTKKNKKSKQLKLF